MADRSVIALLAFTALTSVFSLGCTSSAQTKPATPPPPKVETTRIQPRDVDVYSEYPAQTYARNLVEVRGKVEGYVDKWLFRPGQSVAAGQPLYQLDLRPYRAQVTQAQGSLRQAEADLVFAQQQTSLLQAQASLATSKANLVRAQQDYERLKPLVEQDAASKQDLDAATAALRAAESGVRSNEALVKNAEVNTKTQIQSNEGKVQTNRGVLQTASLNLQYGTIVAPISGLVGDTQVPVGGLVSPNSNQPLTTIVPLDPIWVRFKVSESQYLRFQQLRTKTSSPALELILADQTHFPGVGRIENTLNQVDPRTGTLELQAQFPNAQKTLLPGQFGQVRLVTEHRAGALLVPQRAVTQNQNLQMVYVVGRDSKVQARVVKTGPRVGEEWVIEEGLAPNDQVIVEGLLSIRPGVPVTAVPYQAPANQAKKPASR